ncbi:MAG: hypothetical protein ACKVQA_08020 [Burkholderiales bacterium]
MTKNLLAVTAIMFSLAIPGTVTFAKDAAPAATPVADAPAADAAKTKKAKRAKKKHGAAEAPAK